jgi:pimeloyl-ACP methyl ester carboxylesterase
MFYETHGAGEALVLIGGLNSDHTLFRAFMPRLAGHYRVIVFDNRGIGQSTGAESAFTMATLADDTAGLLRALGITRAHVLGVSLGGRIAAALALQHGDLVRSLMLVSTCLEPPPRTWHQRWVGLLLRLPWVRRGNSYRVVARQRAATRSFDCTERLHEIRVPTLILLGEKDGLAPRDLARKMHEGIAGSRMITFGGGHLFFLLRAAPFMDAVLAFLGSMTAEQGCSPRCPRPINRSSSAASSFRT